MQQVFTMERHILQPSKSQALLVFTNWLVNVYAMLMKNDGDKVQAFRKVLVAGFVDMKVKALLQRPLQIQKWRGTNLAALEPPERKRPSVPVLSHAGP